MRRRRKIKKIFGTPERPRLKVTRSLRHLEAQIIDDSQKKTLVAASTVQKEIKAKVGGRKNIPAAKILGQIIAERALAAGLKKVVFDRGQYKYHGRLKALAEAARAGGLDF